MIGFLYAFSNVFYYIKCVLLFLRELPYDLLFIVILYMAINLAIFYSFIWHQLLLLKYDLIEINSKVKKILVQIIIYDLRTTEAA